MLIRSYYLRYLLYRIHGTQHRYNIHLFSSTQDVVISPSSIQFLANAGVLDLNQWAKNGGKKHMHIIYGTLGASYHSFGL